MFAALVATLPSVGSGLLLDDHVHAAYIQNHLHSGGSRWWDLFDVCCREGSLSVAQRIEVGLLPWWTHPQLSMTLLRPLSVATQYLDYVLWPNTLALMHLHNMAWYALLVVLVGVLYRRIMSGSGVAALAVLLYAVDEAHAEGTAWIATRNTLMTACFAVTALIAHDRAQAARLPSYDRSRVDTLYVLNTPKYFVTSLSPVYASQQAPWPAHLYVLGATAAAFRITRPATAGRPRCASRGRSWPSRATCGWPGTVSAITVSSCRRWARVSRFPASDARVRPRARARRRRRTTLCHLVRALLFARAMA
ncbi:MAG TPA: hypothetical protein VF331_12770 [Polyangiales bacterium]